MKFNKTNASQVELPAGKTEIVVFDDDVPGFGLRVRAGGSRMWVFQYRVGGKQRRVSFGIGYGAERSGCPREGRQAACARSS